MSELQAILGQVDGRLGETQVRSSQLKQAIPGILAGIAAGITVLLLWVGYTQIVVVRLEWTRLRARPGERE